MAAEDRARLLAALEGVAEALQRAAGPLGAAAAGAGTGGIDAAGADEDAVAGGGDDDGGDDDNGESGRAEAAGGAVAEAEADGKDPRGRICQQTLSSSRRMKSLPNMTTVASPLAMKMQMCGLKATCCSVKGFNAVAGQAEKFDLWVDALGSMWSRFESYPQDFTAYALGVLSQNVFTTDLDFGVLYNAIGDHVSHLLGDIGNQNLAIHAAHLVTTVAGYFSALLCASCDPSQKLYVGGNASAHTLTLAVDSGLCLEMGRIAEDVMIRLQLALLDYRNVDAALNVTEELCKTAAAPVARGEFPRVGRDGCLQINKDLKYLHAYASSYPGPFVGALGCSNAVECGKLLCEDTLQGMAYSYEALKANILDQLEKHCVLPHCNPYSLGDYVNYLLPTDKALADSFTEGGPRVSNYMVDSPVESRLDLYSFGCSGYLANSPCTRFEDVTFASAHIKVIVIASSIAGVILALLAAVLWHRYTRRAGAHAKMD